MIEFKVVSKTYPEQGLPSVNNVSLVVNEGETLALVGTSGSGKTTLLKMVNRLIEPTSGSIEIAGRDVRLYNTVVLRRSIGYVFQRFGLLPHFTVGENIALPLKLAGHSPRDCSLRVREMLELMSIPPASYYDRYPDQLSGGEEQRVQVARALSQNPEILLMDEPFGALDVITRSELQDEILRLKAVLKKTIVFVTHDIAEAFYLADRVAIMHQGRIEQVGNRKELMQCPASNFVRAFLHAGFKELTMEAGY